MNTQTNNTEFVRLLTVDTLTSSFFGCPNIYGQNDTCTMQDKMSENPGICIDFPKNFDYDNISAYYAVYDVYGHFDPNTIGVQVGDKIYRLNTI
jgi:hypothetical protein